ncbi:hypothetical protein BX600DRAFT_188442 [Xylariales sp. PMI_506]|nr:hypothetical protein BX600DRAFT_188442 [Xylariales sp. PMI_506]
MTLVWPGLLTQQSANYGTAFVPERTPWYEGDMHAYTPKLCRYDRSYLFGPAANQTSHVSGRRGPARQNLAADLYRVGGHNQSVPLPLSMSRFVPYIRDLYALNKPLTSAEARSKRPSKSINGLTFTSEIRRYFLAIQFYTGRLVATTLAGLDFEFGSSV